jgi:hypothetical protein
LGLGKHLVHELGLNDEVDTLGRWMAHHVAELIHLAENAPTDAERRIAENEAVTTILEIWQHRKALPNDAYPLASYEDLLKVIHRLHPDSSPYLYSSELSRGEELAAALFDRLTHLILSLLFVRWQNIAKKRLDPAAVESMGDEEKEIICAINEWGAIFSPKLEKSEGAKKKRARNDQDTFDFKENSINLIDDIEAVLTELRIKLS